MSKKSIWIISTLVVLIIAIALLLQKRARQKANELPPNLDSLHQTTIEKKIIFSGTIIPSTEINVTAHLSGVLTKLYPQVGDYIHKNDPLALIEIVNNPVEYSNLLKSLSQAKLTREENKVLNERAKTLYQQKAATLVDYQAAENKLKAAELEIDRITAQIDIVTGKGANNLLRSSSEGVVFELPIKQGGSVMGRSSFSEGSVVAKLANMEILYFKGLLTDREVVHLSKQDTLNIKMSALDTVLFKAVVVIISPKATESKDATNARFEVFARLVVPSKYKGKIRAGYNAIAEKTIEQRHAVWATDEANIVFENDSSFLQVYQSNKNWIKKPVQLGLSNGLKVEIVKGVTPNEKFKKGNLPTENL